ncbi:MAG: hypothetical protein HYX34_08765 [Actinobacteria bacterium]|nr:hypothetical protein [Actinomycetota bacterium]
MLFADFEVARATDRLDPAKLQLLVSYLVGAQYPVVYTAFDGDHFAVTPLMRRYCLRHGAVPANPESILGYRDTVEKRISKQGVLRDDLGVLDRCDELWVFTDLGPHAGDLASLAEGVRVELAYFLRRSPGAAVKIVPVGALLAGADPEPLRIDGTSPEFQRLIDPQGEISRFLSGDLVQDGRALPSVAFVAFDVLDSKYMHWLRPYALTFDKVGLVPGLAVELGDVAAAHGDLGCLLVSWANLVRLAQEFWLFPAMDTTRPSGLIPELLLHVWTELRPGGTMRCQAWRDVRVPKALLGAAWPLTSSEQNVMRQGG